MLGHVPLVFQMLLKIVDVFAERAFEVIVERVELAGPFEFYAAHQSH